MSKDNRILLVSGLPRIDKPEALFKIFERCGAIHQIRIGKTPETRGNAIVVFDRVEYAQRAVDEFDGKRLNKDKDQMLSVKIYDEVTHKRAVQRKKRQRESNDEYRSHISLSDVKQ